MSQAVVKPHTERRCINLQKPTWVVLTITIGLFVLLNGLWVRKMALRHFKPTVMVNQHGWPLPALDVILTFNTRVEGLDDYYVDVMTYADEKTLPDDFTWRDDGNIRFKDGSRIKWHPGGMIQDALIHLVVLVLVAFVCERLVFKRPKSTVS